MLHENLDIFDYNYQSVNRLTLKPLALPWTIEGHPYKNSKAKSFKGKAQILGKHPRRQRFHVATQIENRKIQLNTVRRDYILITDKAIADE